MAGAVEPRPQGLGWDFGWEPTGFGLRFGPGFGLGAHRVRAVEPTGFVREQAPKGGKSQTTGQRHPGTVGDKSCTVGDKSCTVGDKLHRG